MRYSKEIKEKVVDQLKCKDGRTSKEIAEEFGIPDYTVRQLAVKYKLKFGHYTPFKSNDNIIISDELNDIIIGSLLGDGTITKNKINEDSSTNKNSKLAIKHSIKQKDYVDFKNDLLSKQCKTYIKSYYKIDNREKFKDQKSYEVETLQNKSFNKYREEWYPNGKKIIPETLNSLSPLTIAIWFQDDGCKHKKGGYYLYTNGFNTEDVEKLCEILKNQYNINTSIHLSSLKQPMIYIRTSSIFDFNKIIKPYMCESMIYKIHIVRYKSDKLLENPEEDNQQPN